MLHIDLPTRDEIEALASHRGAPAVSIYLATTPLSQEAQEGRIALKNAFREALGQMEAAGTAKRAVWPIEEAIEGLEEDHGFWAHQANSLAIFVTPESLRTFRLPNRLETMVEVSDRFHLKPMLRALTFPHNAYVLVLAEGGVRLVEVSADLPPRTVNVPDLPRDASEALGRTTLGDRSPSRRLQAGEGRNIRLRQYARIVDEALRPVLQGRQRPLIIAAADPLASMFRQANSYPNLADGIIGGNAEHLEDHAIAASARTVLDSVYAAELAGLRELFRTREGQGRAITDIAHAARAATFGAIDTLLVDMDDVVPGTVADEDGAVTFADGPSAGSYGIVDEIAGRALKTGARVLAARRGDIPGKGSLAAILRYPL